GRSDEPNDQNIRTELLGEVKQLFNPEFLNRLDDTIIFNALKKEHLMAIVKLQLLDLEKNLASKNVTYSITKAARERIIEEGYDKAYGARPMRRVIQSRIENEIAEKFLRREFREGGHIQIAARGKNLVFTQKFKKSDLPLPEETE
ncbi:MAG: ATP-dependent Clp protease ATP-binding subunit, partial [Candidatus Marinimicrobia bacterium]|nr:ATP-dependent Clp protease ATP-binding subunit [Candidatus Neomarinimicrobiota bacterium]